MQLGSREQNRELGIRIGSNLEGTSDGDDRGCWLRLGKGQQGEGGTAGQSGKAGQEGEGDTARAKRAARLGGEDGSTGAVCDTAGQSETIGGVRDWPRVVVVETGTTGGCWGSGLWRRAAGRGWYGWAGDNTVVTAWQRTA
ncbi:hypothetical protein ACFE04_019184 [Oxalis oulophora]